MRKHVILRIKTIAMSAAIYENIETTLKLKVHWQQSCADYRQTYLWEIGGCLLG